MNILVLSWNENSETTIVSCYSKAGFSESLRDVEDDPFSQLKESINKHNLRDQELVSDDFVYGDMLMVDNNIEVISVVTDEKIFT